jgi:outer membrane protein assembly factor BamB
VPIDVVADAPFDAPREAAVDAARDVPAEAAVDVAVAPDVAVSASSVAVAYQIDPAHTGAQPRVHLALPLSRRWTRDLGGISSYAVVAAGSAFVTVRHGTRYGTSLVALDVATGVTRWGPTELGGTYFWSALAYDNGRVFAVNGDGTLRAFEAATGELAWSVRLPGQYAFSAAPTASGGLVFVGGAGSGGTVYAVRQASGELVWRAPVANGDQSSPAVGGGRVFVSYACNQAYGFDAASGRQLWHHSSGCSGGGGKTTALYAGSLYTRDSPDLILDATTGMQTGTFTSGPIPAFAGAVGYYVGGSTLRAIAAGSTTPRWTFTAPGALITAPIVVGEHVVVAGLSGRLYALSTADGTVAGSDTLPSIAGVDEQNVSAPLSGLSAAEGTLFVPTGSGLAAYNGRDAPASP